MHAKYGLKLGGRLVEKGTQCRFATTEELRRSFGPNYPLPKPEGTTFAVVFDGFDVALVHEREVAHSVKGKEGGQ